MESSKTKILIITLITLISIRLWSFQLISDANWEYLEVFGILLIVFIFLFKKKQKIIQSEIKTLILFMIIVMFLSSIPALLIREQSLTISLIVLRGVIFWLLFFVLHSFNLSSTTLIKIITIIAAIWLILIVTQQFTYPHYWFASRTDTLTNKMEIRNGFYRFMTYRHHYAMLLVFYFFYKYLANRKIHYLLISFIFLAGLYVFATRQFIFSTLFTILTSVFFLNKKYRMLGWGVVLIWVFLSYYYFDVIFAEFAEKTVAELNSKNIRLSSTYFFLFEHWKSPLNYLFGNGVASYLSSYGQEIFRLNQLGLYQSDIGIIGSFSRFGIFYVIIVFSIHFLIIIKSNRIQNYYLRMFFISNLILLPMTDYFFTISAIPFYSIVFYLFDKSLKE